MRMGNVTFDKVEKRFGFKLTEEDKILYDKFYNQNADLSDMDSCFHCYDMPKSIVFKGEEAKNAIIKIFTEDKLINPMGEIPVLEKE